MPNPWDVGHRPACSPASATRRSRRRAAGSRSRSAAATARAPCRARRRSSTRPLIAAATDLPVNGDLENGFGHDPESVAETIRGAAAAGLVGCSIEDSTSRRGEPIYPLAQAVERIAAARRGGRRAAVPVHPDGARRELPARPQRPRRHDRAPAGVREGGRRCALCPGPARHRGHPHRLRGAVCSPSTCSRCRALRASRCSRPPASGASVSAAGFINTALGAFIRAARDVHEHGTFGSLDGSSGSADIAAFMQGADRA